MTYSYHTVTPRAPVSHAVDVRKVPRVMGSGQLGGLDLALSSAVGLRGWLQTSEWGRILQSPSSLLRGVVCGGKREGSFFKKERPYLLELESPAQGGTHEWGWRDAMSPMSYNRALKISADQNPLVSRWCRRGENEVKRREKARAKESGWRWWYLLDHMRIHNNVNNAEGNGSQSKGYMACQKTRTVSVKIFKLH